MGRIYAYPVSSRKSTFPWSPQPNGATRARSSSCPRNMRPSSLSLTTKQHKRTSLPASRRATTTCCRGTAWAAWTAAVAVAKSRELSSSSARGIPLSWPRPTAWRRRCGLGVSRPRPTTASSAGVARQCGRPKGWGRSSFPVWSLGTRFAQYQYPAPLCKPSSTGSRVEASRSSAVATRGSRPNRLRNAARLALRALFADKQLLWGDRGGSPSERSHPP